MKINTTTQQPETTIDLAEQVAPQHSAISWALRLGRVHLADDPNGTLILIAFAQHAQASLFSGDGYNGTTAAEASRLLSFSADPVDVEWARNYAERLVARGLLEDGYRADTYRVPEAALDGSWVR